MSEPRKNDLRRSFWLLVALIAITFTMRWALSRGKAERLLDLPATSDSRLIGIRGDEAIFLSNIEAPEVVLRARSLTTHTTRDICTDEGLRNAFSIVLTDDALYYKSTPADSQNVSAVNRGGPQKSGPVAALVPGAPRTAGAAAASPKRGLAYGSSDAATPMPTVTMRNQPPRGAPWPLEGAGDPPGAPQLAPPPSEPPVLMRLSLSGGASKEIKAPLGRNPTGQRDYAVLGGHVYFTRFIPSPPPAPWAPIQKRRTATVELLSYSVSGGKMAVVQRVPGILTMLYGMRSRLYWIVARPENPARVDLYHMGPNDTQLHCVRDYQSWFPPVATADRLVWITRQFVRHNPKAAAVTLDTSDLVTSTYDGQDLRVVEHIIEDGQTLRYVGRPVADRNRVYVQVSNRDSDPDGMNRHEVLCRVRTDFSGLDHIVDLPLHATERGFIEGGWFYFNVAERRQGWLDYMRDGADLKYVEVLHRLRLPEN